MRIFAIANAQARNGRAARKAARFLSEVARRGLHCETVWCQSLRHARALSADANRGAYDMILALGGDGTINRVFNGFYDAAGRRVSKTLFGAVHTGTSPDFCRSYGMPTDIPAAVRAVEKAETRAIRLGRVEWLASNPSPAAGAGPGFFGCCANIGIGALVARLANGGIRKYLGDFGGTFISLLRALRKFRPRRLDLCLDGQKRTEQGVYDLAIGRTRYVASGLKVAHDLAPADGRFYVLCLHSLTWLALPAVIRALYAPPRASAERLSRYLWQTSARSIAVSSPDPSEVEYDGDPAGQCPCLIGATADPLDVVVDGPCAD